MATRSVHTRLLRIGLPAIGWLATVALTLLTACKPSPTPFAPVGPDLRRASCPIWGCGIPPVRLRPLPREAAAPGLVPPCPAAFPMRQPPPKALFLSDGESFKDTDLMLKELQEQEESCRAAIVAERFQMDFEAAVELVRLSDKIASMTAQGQQMTPYDESAVATQAFDLAGVSAGDVVTAVNHSLQGDNSAEDALLSRIAANLGMPSPAILRERLLPALGINP